MNIIVDMNLPPRWVDFLEAHGLHAVHWSAVGDLKAPDSAAMKWARQRDHAVFAHDLDFGILLSLSREAGPSIIQGTRKSPRLPIRSGFRFR